jgi:HAD superfamily hydrolase (TIGR01509 family)
LFRTASTATFCLGPLLARAPLGHFRKIFLSSAIGLRKPDAAAYDHVAKAIGVAPERIVFFDDLAENIEGARAYGLNAVHVTSSGDVAQALAALGI